MDKGIAVVQMRRLATADIRSPSHSQWFSVLSQVHASTDQEIREMHDEQANPQNAVVSEHLCGGGNAPGEARELGISRQSLFFKRQYNN